MTDDSRRILWRAWRASLSEARFVECIRDWLRLSEEERALGARFHEATYSFLVVARSFYDEARRGEIPEASPSPAELQGHRLPRQLWSFFLASKATLDALAREINLVYWALDPLKRFFHPLDRQRWVTFYTVREKVLLSGERDDPLIPLLVLRTRSPTADRPYRDLSHLATACLVHPPVIAAVHLAETGKKEPITVSDAVVYLADDFLSESVTTERAFEVTRLGREIVVWLEQFMDDVYERLEILIRRYA